MPTDEDEQSDFFFFNHPERGDFAAKACVVSATAV